MKIQLKRSFIRKKSDSADKYGDMSTEKEQVDEAIELKVGHMVDINSGDYSGLSGQISRIIDNDEYIVDVQILGKLVSVKLNKKQLKLSV